MTNDRDTDVCFGLDASAAGAPNLGVPGQELGHGDAVLSADGVAALVALNKMERITVVHHARLGGEQCLYAIARVHGGGGWWDCGAGGRDGRTSTGGWKGAGRRTSGRGYRLIYPNAV